MGRMSLDLWHIEAFPLIPSGYTFSIRRNVQPVSFRSRGIITRGPRCWRDPALHMGGCRGGRARRAISSLSLTCSLLKLKKQEEMPVLACPPDLATTRTRSQQCQRPFDGAWADGQ